ncbi:hypothetical protein G7046_g5619 [Stylonectria norvegica]|nr:hypothetical protein G7046_g5619 [Stylonectria norvegica]
MVPREVLTKLPAGKQTKIHHEQSAIARTPAMITDLIENPMTDLRRLIARIILTDTKMGEAFYKVAQSIEEVCDYKTDALEKVVKGDATQREKRTADRIQLRERHEVAEKQAAEDATVSRTLNTALEVTQRLNKKLEKQLEVTQRLNDEREKQFEVMQRLNDQREGQLEVTQRLNNKREKQLGKLRDYETDLAKLHHDQTKNRGLTIIQILIWGSLIDNICLWDHLIFNYALTTTCKGSETETHPLRSLQLASRLRVITLRVPPPNSRTAADLAAENTGDTAMSTAISVVAADITKAAARSSNCATDVPGLDLVLMVH